MSTSFRGETNSFVIEGMDSNSIRICPSPDNRKLFVPFQDSLGKKNEESFYYIKDVCDNDKEGFNCKISISQRDIINRENERIGNFVRDRIFYDTYEGNSVRNEKNDRYENKD